MLNPIYSRLVGCSTFTSVVTSIFHTQYVSPSFYLSICIVYNPVNRPVCLCTWWVCSVRCDGCTVVWHYCSTKWKEPVHSHRKRECDNFVYSFWSLYWSCIKPFESEVFCTFQFHAVLGKNCQNNRLSPLLGLATSRLGNQESATPFASFGRNISYRSLTPSKDQL